MAELWSATISPAGSIVWIDLATRSPQDSFFCKYWRQSWSVNQRPKFFDSASCIVFCSPAMCYAFPRFLISMEPVAAVVCKKFRVQARTWRHPWSVVLVACWSMSSGQLFINDILWYVSVFHSVHMSQPLYSTLTEVYVQSAFLLQPQQFGDFFRAMSCRGYVGVSESELFPSSHAWLKLSSICSSRENKRLAQIKNGEISKQRWKLNLGFKVGWLLTSS